MTDQLQKNERAKPHPPSDPVSVDGRLLANRRGYTDAGSVQARTTPDFSVVAYKSAVHRRGVGRAER